MDPRTISTVDQFEAAYKESLNCEAGKCVIRTSVVGASGSDINIDRIQVRHDDACPYKPAWQEPDMPEINEDDDTDEDAWHD